MDVRLTTYRDLLDHAVDFLGANPGGDASRDARRAVQNAYRELTSECRWSYFLTRGRIVTSAPQTTGTVAYDHTGGAYERMLTISDGTWPSWAAEGVVTLSNLVYEVAARKSDTVLTLKGTSNPGADVAAGTAYTIYRDTYPLPVDCLAIDRVILLNNAFSMWYEHPGTWLERQRIYHSPAVPRVYTVTGSTDYLGSMVIRFFPAPDNAYALDFIYHRRPRPLKQEDLRDGTVSTSNGSATLTGSGTDWTSRLAGSVVRVSNSATDFPTGEAGGTPAYFERIVLSVESATSLTMDAVVDEDLSGVKYLVSDPADIEEGAMLHAFLRGVEKQVAQSRSMKTLPLLEQTYKTALIKCREADNRDMSLRTAGPSVPYPYRLAQMPRGPDVS